MQTALYTLLMEYCSPTKRTIAALAFELMWALGLIFLGGVAYAVRDWRNLQLFLALPTICTISWVWLVQESMHWLYTNHRERDAFKVCVRTAKYNGNYSSIESEHRYWLDKIRSEKPVSNNDSIEKNDTNSAWVILRDIFLTPCLRKHIFIMASTWFIVAMDYYGVLFFMPAIAGDRHLNFILGGIIEFCVCLSMYFVVNKFGVRIITMIYIFVTGLLLVVVGICSSYVTEGTAIIYQNKKSIFNFVEFLHFRDCASNCYITCSWNVLFSVSRDVLTGKRIISDNKSRLCLWNMRFHGEIRNGSVTIHYAIGDKYMGTEICKEHFKIYLIFL